MTERDASEGWSTGKFLLIVLVVDFVLMFTLNGVLNEVLHLGVPSSAIGVAPSFVTVLLMTRWRWFRQRMAKK
ncbi:MAG TPA: hypothetical protein VG755_38425 [Nannocystaceae bacterium]|nr:hypothetical protein [Nannocystaceae bacterium]